MPLTIAEEFGLSDVGRQRQTNEDSYLESSPIFAVADGMGGAKAGEVASRLAVEAFAQERDTSASPEAQLEHVAKAANRRIYEMAQEDTSRAGMGTTFTAVMVTGNELAIGHVGDSRAYRWREGKLERLTQDHSLVEELVRQGKIKPEEAETHPQKSIITRALGPEPDVEVETFTYPARDGDVYLLCSDGLTGMVNEPAMSEILGEAGSLEEAGTRLVEEANANGGRDNITVVLFRLAGSDEEADASDTLSGSETKVGGVSVETVRAAVRDADEAEGAQDDSTTALGPQEAARARAGPDAQRTTTRAHPRAEPAPRDDITRIGRVPDLPSDERPRRRRTRRWLALALVLLVIAAVVAGLYAGSRQFWFIGTNDRGVVTLYRGLPYDLPFGLDLYDEEYVSSVPASSIQPARQRSRIVDQQLRSHGDAVDLIRQVERQHAGR